MPTLRPTVEFRGCRFGRHYSLQVQGEIEYDASDRVSAPICRACHQGVAVIEEQWIGDHPGREGLHEGGTITWRGVHWWPAPGTHDLDEVIPVLLRDAYAEGLRCLGVKAPRAAAVMFRRRRDTNIRSMTLLQYSHVDARL